MNDCHDEGGKFCEGGGSSGAGSSPRRTGIGPQGSVHTAEKRGKEYGYAKKLSFYQCTSLDQANEINAQMAELSDETGLVLERVYVYKEGGKSKDAPKDAAGYHQGSVGTIGIRNGVTAAYALENAPYKPGQQAESARWLREYADNMEQEHLSGERAKVDPKLVEAFRYQAKQAEETQDYSAFTVPGNGTRNPTVDHEFAHALVDRAVHSETFRGNYGETRVIVNDRAVVRLNDFGARCRQNAKTTKFSVYAATGINNRHWVTQGEPIAETYAYWKSGGLVPDDIQTGLRRLEQYGRAK